MGGGTWWNVVEGGRHRAARHAPPLPLQTLLFTHPSDIIETVGFFDFKDSFARVSSLAEPATLNLNLLREVLDRRWPNNEEVVEWFSEVGHDTLLWGRFWVDAYFEHIRVAW